MAQNSEHQRKYIKGTVSRQGFARTSASKLNDISSKAEKVMFSIGGDSTATAFMKTTVTAAKTTAKTAVMTAYYTHKINYTLGGKIINGVVGGVRFARNPVMADGQTYRKHLKTRFVRRVKNLKPVRAVTITKNGVKTVANGVRKTYRITKAIAKGDIKITKETIAYAGKKTAKAIGKGTVGLAKASGKTAVRGLKTGVRFAPRTASALGSALGNALSSTGNEYVGALGTAVKTAGYTVKATATTVKTAVKTEAHMVKTGYQGVRKIATGFSYVKRNGIRKSAKRLGKNALSKTGKSIVKLFTNFFAFGARMLATPAVIAVVAFVAMGAAAIVTTLGAAVNVVEGTTTGIIHDVVEIGEKTHDFLSTDDIAETVAKAAMSDEELAGAETEEISEEDWLIEHIKATKALKREEVKEIMEKDLVKNGGKYHEIRFYNGFTDLCLPLEDEKDSSIERTMYSDEQLYELIQPIFHNILLVKYDLRPRESEMIILYEEMIKEMMTIKTAETDSDCHWTEWCSQGTEPKTDDPIKCAECGHVHAEESCLNVIEGNHGDDNYTCSVCCHKYYKCKGHKGDLKCTMQEHDHCSKYEAEEYFKGVWKSGGTVYTGMEYGGWELTGWTSGFHTFYYNCKYGGGGDCTGHHHNDWHNKDDSGCYKTMFHHADGSYNEWEPSGDDIRCTSPCDNSEEHSYCTGYRHCEGHEIEKIYFKSADTDLLLDKYYDDDIKTIEEKGDTATEEEKKTLKTLKDNRGIVEECIGNLAELYGNSDKEIDTSEIEDLVNFRASIAYGCVINNTPYVVGGDDLKEGVDDIGLVCGVYNDMMFKHDYVSLATDDNITLCDYKDVTQGDIIFYSYSGETDSIYHVGIYIGNDLMVHASNSGSCKVVKVYREAIHFIGKVS